MVEFTGERVIPGQVDPDLWNEHYARYLFASRLARFRRVLDAGCGSGYGTELLAATARAVIAVDVAPEALELTRERTAALPNVEVRQGSATELPLEAGTVDLVVAFEVIEHLENWPALIAEAKRVLAPGGQFIVSTPNADYYGAQRGASGPNPFHAHEFSFAEFREALTAAFPHVSFFVQNHTAGIVFRPLDGASSSDVKIEAGLPDAASAHFFIAVCAASPQTGAPNFVYVPSAANVLKEREAHIGLLAGELGTKDQWLAEARAEHASLVEQFRAQQAKLEESNRWAAETQAKADAAQARNAALQEELAAEQRRGAEVVSAYERRLAELEEGQAEAVRWAQETEARLTRELIAAREAFEARGAEVEAKARELADCVALLDRAEQTVIERTLWAQGLEQRLADLEAGLSSVRSSRWIKLGRSLGLGPRVAE